mmetsp:Transcript_12828/g.36434  ORF Transcript_12828/g.36434 Transcript_12828/m.36434 type:complete len:289 (-) Transcript_12828:234-1100(-)
MRPCIQRSLHDVPRLEVIAVAHLDNQAGQGQEDEGSSELCLLLHRQNAKSVREHAEAEGIRRQEPGWRIPDLRGEGKPGLQHRHGKECMPRGYERPAEGGVDPHEHGAEEQEHHEVEGPEAHDPRDCKLHRIVQPLRTLPLTELCGGVCRNVAGEHEEGAHNNIDLCDELEEERVHRGRVDEMSRSDVRDEEEADAVKGIDPRLLLCLAGGHGLALGRLFGLQSRGGAPGASVGDHAHGDQGCRAQGTHAHSLVGWVLLLLAADLCPSPRARQRGRQAGRSPGDVLEA